VRLALADAFDFGRVQRIDLGASLALILEADLGREIEKMAEALLQPGIAVDAAADVADDTAQAGAQELELAPSAPELVRMGVAANHDGSALGNAQIL
jgi:hypothetical protein